MIEKTYVVALEVVDSKTAEVEFEYAVCIATPEVTVTTLGSQGPAGPRGESSEEESVFSKRVDFVTEDLIYRGEAAVGSANSASVWRIRRITFVGDDVTEEWASGSAAFDKAWTDRATLGYS